MMDKRFRLYDKLKISVRTMDRIIYGVVALIALALVIGVVLGGR